jgi:hypothetical protein
MPRKNTKNLTVSTKASGIKTYHANNPECKRIIKKDDVLILRKILRELESDDYSEPFLLPVDYKGNILIF